MKPIITLLVLALLPMTVSAAGPLHPNFYPIGSSGYSYAQYPLPTAPSGATHTVTSTAPMCVEVYGFGWMDGYGYMGNLGF